jgi:hypothetical protein
MFSSLQNLAYQALDVLSGGIVRKQMLEQQAQLAAELEHIRDMRAEFVLATLRLKELILSQPNGDETIRQLMDESSLLAEIWADEDEALAPSAANDR